MLQKFANHFWGGRFGLAGVSGLAGVGGLGCWSGLALIVWLVGCGGGEPSSARTTDWIHEGTSGEGNERTAEPVFSREAFQANDFHLELDEERLAALQNQYATDVAGVTRESAPTEVARAFVHLLHAEDLQSAERLLTLKARAVIHESGLELGPIAGSRAEYVLGEARYTTNARDLAYVDCFVRDPELAAAGQGQNGEFKVTWALRPESIYGWRVYGMVSEENGTPQMVSFESSQHTTAISRMYDQPSGLEQETARQATSGRGETLR